MTPWVFAGASSHDSSSPPVTKVDAGTHNLRLKGLSCVVAEDEGMTQLQLRRALRMEGVEVVGLACNGEEAVKLVEQFRPDFILMDIRMPVMDGLEASRLILDIGPFCIILLTAFSDDEYRQEAFDIGAKGYILKPITSETLIPQIKSALARFLKH